MKSKSLIPVFAASLVATGGALLLTATLSAQQSTQLLPSSPAKGFGASVTPSYEGWYDNPDGTHSLLIGYYSRNTREELDVPIGPNNRFEPGNPDMGQPTHFLTSRRFGMFTVTVPKEFNAKSKLAWTLTANGVTTTIPVNLGPDFNITTNKSSEQDSFGHYNTPPVLRFDAKGASFQAPVATPLKAVARAATAGQAMTLDIFADDDANYTSATNAPLRNPPPPVTLVLSKYRGPGAVTFDNARPKVTATKGGKPGEPFEGKATAKVTFSEPGDYMLHVQANDYSGNGGGGFACCWTTALVKVAVGASERTRQTGNQ
ncbi:MAG: hypothetical protein LBQ09_12075 [Acidobacteriaceae bacterium]|jgi:hypothetical protein|nr:hypothetical protein [Acidobacteriaceae bacterium]